MRSLVVASIACLLPAAASAMDLALTGAWSTTIDAGDLDASGQLVGTHDSATDAVLLDITLTTDAADTWRIDVRRSDTTWDPNVRVWVRRTGSGTGAGFLEGGASFVEVGAANALFFSGGGDRSGVTVQVRITGVSLGVPPSTYASTLVYTLVDT